MSVILVLAVEFSVFHAERWRRWDRKGSPRACSTVP